MIFLVLSGKMIFLFPENMILFFRHKRKDDISQKNVCKNDIFFKCMFWKDGLSKKFAPEHDLFCNICKDGISLFQKLWYLFFRRKLKEDYLYQKRVEIWYFLYICVGVKSMTLSSWQKKTRIPLPRKNTPRVDISGITEKYDVHPGKYGIFAEIPHWLTPEKEPKKQPPEMFCRKRFS